MTVPVVGPTTTTVSNTASYVYVKTTYRQKPPYDLVLPYDMKRYIRTFLGSHGVISCLNTGGALDMNPSGAMSTLAFEKLKGKIAEKAELGVFLAELSQSTRMIAKRATQLSRAYRALRRGQLNVFFNELGVSKRRRGTHASKDVAGLWLEYSFGWTPMIGDVYDAVSVLQSSFREIRVSASARNRYVKRRPECPVISEGTTYDRQRYEESVWTGVAIKVTNPNLWLANSLGLINPAVVAWELVPFSFVVDWFSTVGTFLSHGTDMLGLSQSKAYTSKLVKGWEASRYHYQWAPYGTGPTKIEAVKFSRVASLPSVGISFRPVKLPHWKRAANATSLLVQLFR
jgi:hypothetical protein